MDEVSVRARVRGRVQGVWFRGWTAREAARLALRGWVRNEPDGSVSVALAGPEDRVAEMLRLLHQGPEHARVDSVETSPAPPPPGEGFAVIR